MINVVFGMEIKCRAEDFVVDEEFTMPALDGGQFSYFVLGKRGMNTSDAVRLVARLFWVNSGSIGYAGLKDRVSVSSQLISVKGLGKGFRQDFARGGVSLRFLGTGSSPVTLGCLKGNLFSVVARRVSREEASAFVQKVHAFSDKNYRMPNFFGEQRFGNSNHLVGKAIISGDLKAAARMVFGSVNGDCAAALRSLPRKMALLYVHAYQSFLFNRCLSALASDTGEFSLPLVGFGTELESLEGRRGIVADILEEECVRPRSFVVRSLPELSCEGGERAAFVRVRDFRHRMADDEMNPGFLKCELSFWLPKGSYATVLVRFLFGELSEVCKPV
ncbi:tRNA pseudouridine(13) synthase TruD [Candidatus Woesearchaeota archaeon]|nr:tRNA pseudouridine(13) synthase TruD [Candidatus Woesearchaeota archaeon]